MKNTLKILGIIAMVALIGFSMVSCSDEDDVKDILGGDNLGGGDGKTVNAKVTISSDDNSAFPVTIIKHIKLTTSEDEKTQKTFIDEDVSIPKGGKKDFNVEGAIVTPGLDSDYIMFGGLLTYSDENGAGKTHKIEVTARFGKDATAFEMEFEWIGSTLRLK